MGRVTLTYEPKLPPIRQSIAEAARVSGVSVQGIMGRSRVRRIAHAFKRDHTTIIHGVRAEAARRANQ